MLETLLPELETAARTAVHLEALEERGSEVEQVLHEYLRDVGKAVRGMRGSAQLFANIWRSIVLLVARNHTTEMHAAREWLRRTFAHRLELLERTSVLARKLRQLYGEDAAPAPEILTPEIAAMSALKAKV